MTIVDGAKPCFFNSLRINRIARPRVFPRDSIRKSKTSPSLSTARQRKYRLPSDHHDHLVQVPSFGRSWPPTLNPPRICPAEFQDPSSNCLIRDVETTLGKQVLNVPIAQRETAIEPDGMLDDDRWKAVTTVGYLAHSETLKHRPCRSHAVNVTMPSGRIARSDTDRRPQKPSCQTLRGQPTLLMGYGWPINLTRAKL